NVSNPNQPTLTGSLTSTGIFKGVAVANGIAYLADQQGTLQTVDVSTPGTPHALGSTTLTGFGSRVAVTGTRAGVISGTSTNDWLDSIDVTGPATPVRTGSVALGTVGTGKGIAALGGLAYVAGNTTGLQIYNLTSGATPLYVMTAPTAGAALDVVVP